MGFNPTSYVAPNFDRTIDSYLREALIVFNGLNFGIKKDDEIYKQLEQNPDCIYHHEVHEPTGAICSHKITWTKTKRAIDYINNGSHAKWSKACLCTTSDKGICLSLYYKDNPKIIAMIVLCKEDKISKMENTKRQENFDNWNTSAFLANHEIPDIRIGLIY